MISRLIPIAVSALFVAFAADPPLPKAEAILDKYIQVTGGRALYEKIQSELAMGTLEIVGKGVKGILTMYQAAPGLSYVIVEIEGAGKIEQGTNGEIAWERSALQGARLKTGQERSAALREASMSSRVAWRQHYTKAELTGVENVGGQDCYKIVMTPKDGSPETRYYDKKTSLLIKKDIIAKTPMGEFPAETLVSDYKEVDGILTPHRIKQKVLGQELETAIHSIKYNAAIPKSRFDLPDDVKALVDQPAVAPAKK